MRINRQDTNGVKPLLAVGELGYDNYSSGGDIGRVYVGTGSSNIAQAKKAEVVAVDGKVDTHVARNDNPHSVTKTQVGLSNVDNTSDTTKVVASAGKWTTSRLINGTAVDGTVNITTSQWGTSRNITIGSTAKSVNGSVDTSWSLAEIGAIGAASPAFTGIPTAPTAAVNTNTTQLATTAFVNAKIANDAIPRVVSTDNAIVRFDGVTGDVQNSSVIIDDTGNIGSGTQSFNGYGGSGFKNYIINGNFDIWQRGTSQTSSGYGSDDRWANTTLGSTKTHSQVACTDTEKVNFNAGFYTKTIVTSVAGAGNYVYKAQAIEDVTRLAGKTVTLSFWAKADSNKNIAVEFAQVFGTGGSPSSVVSGIGSHTIALTTLWKKYTITVTLPSIVGKTIGTDGVHTSSTFMSFWFDAGSNFNTRTANLGQQSGTFGIAQVQLEEGSVATPFENRPIGLELSLCQRYLPTATGFYAGHAATNAEVYLSVANNVEPRVPPTGILYQLNGNIYYTNTGSAITNITFFAGGITSNTLKINPTGAPLTIGQGVMVGLPKILFTGCEL